MGLSASQGRLLLLTAKQNDLEFQAQQISQKRLILSQQLEQISKDYEEATNDRQMKIHLYAQTNDENGNKSTRDVNLTYAYLVSAAAKQGENWDSGIQASEKVGTVDMEYSTDTVAFRLVDVSGAIVVSDESEIPTKYNTTPDATKTDAAAEGTNVYNAKNTDADGTQHNNFYVHAAAGNGTETALYKALSSSGTKSESNGATNYKSQNCQLSDDKKYVKLNGTWYEAASGNAADTTAVNSITINNNYQATVVSNKDDIPQQTQQSEAQYTDYVKKEGADGKITLCKQDGTIVHTYIVDPSLRSGSTDSDGNTSSGPNYIQDCIRNGKYLLQKHRTETENNDKNTWNNVSWDAITTISDQYYTENDNTAKAKYDRLQGEIERQDKKLELELDNIESERNAVKTEIESVNKVINDNISASFKYFDA